MRPRPVRRDLEHRMLTKIMSKSVSFTKNRRVEAILDLSDDVPPARHTVCQEVNL